MTAGGDEANRDPSGTGNGPCGLLGRRKPLCAGPLNFNRGRPGPRLYMELCSNLEPGDKGLLIGEESLVGEAFTSELYAPVLGGSIGIVSSSELAV